MTEHKLIIAEKSVDNWWNTIWWINFETNCLENNPESDATVDFINKHLISYNARYVISFNNMPGYESKYELIFNSIEDYLAFVLEWS